MRDNEFHALMLSRVLKRDNEDKTTGLMIKLNPSGTVVERLYNVATGKTINTRTIDHIDIDVLERDGWDILPESTPLQ